MQYLIHIQFPPPSGPPISRVKPEVNTRKRRKCLRKGDVRRLTQSGHDAAFIPFIQAVSKLPNVFSPE